MAAAQWKKPRRKIQSNKPKRFPLNNARTKPAAAPQLLDSAQPLVRRLPGEWTPDYCFERMASQVGCVWLDSSLTSAELGRYSYLAADPFTTLRIDKPQSGVDVRISQLIREFSQAKLPGLPPMQGGWMGWLGYELGCCFERLPVARHNEFHLPLAVLGMYDVVLSWDHLRGEGWIISQGFPAVQPHERQRRAYRRMQHFLRLLEAGPTGPSVQQLVKRQAKISPLQLSVQYPTRWSQHWTSNFSPELYRAAIARGVEYIRAGDIFQVNLSQRLLHRAITSPEQLMLHLRRLNPAPFSGYADFGRVQVISTSPERFISVTDGLAEARPIKGTRPRLSNPTADAGMAQLLLESEKDRSENVMIVDLLRNDLSRVAEQDSVKVSQLCSLEKYRYVWHLVSTIQARLRPECSTADAIAASFPGGSITGAPKLRAMEIIAELEPNVRGPYCGSLGYLSFAGDMDLSILIRTLTACDGWWQLSVGGGIVADSDPSLEEQETWHKAEGILRAIDSLPSRGVAAP